MDACMHSCMRARACACRSRHRCALARMRPSQGSSATKKSMLRPNSYAFAEKPLSCSAGWTHHARPIARIVCWHAFVTHY